MRWLSLVLVGCSAWFGLDELDDVPADFPVPVGGEVGHVTASSPDAAGRVAVSADFAFDDEAAARAHYDAVIAHAVGTGWAEAGPIADPPGVRLVRGDEVLRVHCCPRRADARRLVLVNWVR